MTINDTEDFMYYFFKSFLELEKQNDGWVGYDELLEYMEKQDYAAAFTPRGMEEFFTTYLSDYDSLNIFEERNNESGDLELKLQDTADGNNIRWVFELFQLPHRLTDEGTFRKF